MNLVLYCIVPPPHPPLRCSAQQLLVALDTGFPYFWVIDSRCTSEACVGDTISNHSKAKFNAKYVFFNYVLKKFFFQSASSTLHGKGNAISLPCVNCGRGVEGDGIDQKRLPKIKFDLFWHNVFQLIFFFILQPEHVQLEATRGHYHQDRLMVNRIRFVYLTDFTTQNKWLLVLSSIQAHMLNL